MRKLLFPSTTFFLLLSLSGISHAEGPGAPGVLPEDEGSKKTTYRGAWQTSVFKCVEASGTNDSDNLDDEFNKKADAAAGAFRDRAQNSGNHFPIKVRREVSHSTVSIAIGRDGLIKKVLCGTVTIYLSN